MKDRLANQINSYRARLACLDRPEHRAIWLDQPPLKFTQKVAKARALLAELSAMAGKQAADLTAIAAEKSAARKTLIEEAHWLGRIVVVYARDQRNETLAAPYDPAPYQWQGMRDLAVLQKARSLEKDVARIIADSSAETEDYALTADILAVVTAAADAFDERIAALQTAIAHRSQLTAALPAKSRAVKAKFAELEALISSFGVTPAGKAFVAAYRASRQIIDRGRGWNARDGDGEKGGSDGAGANS